MDFAHLVKQDGPWSKLWLAAHWEKKLTKQDFLVSNVSTLLPEVLDRHDLLSLRSTGHLLLGACKIHGKQMEAFESDAREMVTKLALSYEGSKQARLSTAHPPVPTDDVLENILRKPEQGWAFERVGESMLNGKCHVARMEDITLRKVADLSVAQDANDEAFGFASHEDLEAIAKLRNACGLPPTAVSNLSALLVPLDIHADYCPMDLLRREARKPEEMSAPSSPISPDALLEDEVRVGMLHDDDGPCSGTGCSRAISSYSPRALKKRRFQTVFDIETEISEGDYHELARDPRYTLLAFPLDYRLTLPNLAPAMPLFPTMFTDLSPALVETVRTGSVVANHRRDRLSGSLGQKVSPSPSVLASSRAVAAVPLVIPSEGAPDEDTFCIRRSVFDEDSLIARAPETMGDVIEDKDNAAAGKDCENRTENMHRWLAKEFKDASNTSMSYGALCRRSAAVKRQIIASCFSELLVLRTNGIINMTQSTPYEDIQISKSTRWARDDLP